MSETKQIDDGGPAEDMTLLDWFAGMALQGLLAMPTSNVRGALTSTILASHAYEIAKDMLAARKAVR